MPSKRQTAITRKTISIPLKNLIKNLDLKEKVVLDYGCGRGKDLEFLKENCKEANGYDEYWSKELIRIPYDIIFCTYVLNVIRSEEERRLVIKDIQSLLKDDGFAFITVRRDLKLETKTQFNVKIDYQSTYKNSNYEIYKVKKNDTSNERR